MFYPPSLARHRIKLYLLNETATR